MRTVIPGQELIDQFPVWDWDGHTKVSGHAVFQVSLWKDSVMSLVPVTVAEIGTSGEYRVSFTPNSEGIWACEVINTYNWDSWYGEYQASLPKIDIQASMADNNTDAVFALWVEQDGVRQTDFGSMEAAVKDSQGNTVHDFGENTSPTSDGVYRFAIGSSVLAQHVPYLIAATAVRGTESYSANLGFAKA